LKYRTIKAALPILATILIVGMVLPSRGETQGVGFDREYLLPVANSAARGPKLIVRLREGVKKPFRVNKANQKLYTPAIDRIAKKHRLDPALVHAVISVESGYNPRAVSPKGAMGLMQLMPATAERFGVKDPYDPTSNIDGGVRYLRWLMKHFKNPRLAVAAYNAGENAVKQYKNTVPPYPETQHYVIKVLNLYMYYRLDRKK
jgi:soluble lytic murein transglycosylase-like protein